MQALGALALLCQAFFFFFYLRGLTEEGEVAARPEKVEAFRVNLRYHSTVFNGHALSLALSLCAPSTLFPRYQDSSRERRDYLHLSSLAY